MWTSRQYDTYEYEMHGSIRVRDPRPHSDSDHPLLKRAWVLQERLLSRRVLHFGRRELIWECMEVSDCECGDFNTIHWPRAKSIMSNTHNEKSRSDEYAQWVTIVEDYSKLVLSRPEDVLPAVPGIAKRLNCAKECRYLASLWENDLLRGLCLRTIPGTDGRRPPKWRAPTFTWASIISSAGVDWSGRLVDGGYQCQVIATQCTPTTIDPFGKLLDGFVDIRGLLFRAYTLKNLDYNLEYGPSVPGSPWQLAAAPFSNPPSQVKLLHGDTYWDCVEGIDGDQIVEGENIYCL